MFEKTSMPNLKDRKTIKSKVVVVDIEKTKLLNIYQPVKSTIYRGTTQVIMVNIQVSTSKSRSFN